MENVTDVISKWPYGSKMAFGTARWGVVGNVKLQAGVVLFTSLLGLVTYICVFWYQRAALSLLKRSFIMSFSCEHVNLRGVQNAHVSLFALIAAIIYGSHLVASACSFGNTCQDAYNLWIFSRWFEMIVHLLTAFIVLLCLCCPHLGAELCCVFSVISLLTCVFYYSFAVYTRVALYMLNAVIIGLAMAIVATSVVSPVSRSAATKKALIVILAMCTFFFAFLPSFVLECLIDSQGISELYIIILTNVFYLTNFHVFLNGLLCCLILKLSTGEQEDKSQQWELQQRRQQQPARESW